MFYTIAVPSFRATSTAEALQYTQLLMECSNSACNTRGTSFAVGSTMTNLSTVDEVSKWWAAMIAIAAHWLSGDDNAAERLYGITDVFPKQLQSTAYVQFFIRTLK